MRITLGLFSALLMILPHFLCTSLCKSLFFDYCVAIFGNNVFLILYHKIANLSTIKWKKGAAEVTPSINPTQKRFCVTHWWIVLNSVRRVSNITYFHDVFETNTRFVIRPQFIYTIHRGLIIFDLGYNCICSPARFCRFPCRTVGISSTNKNLRDNSEVFHLHFTL